MELMSFVDPWEGDDGEGRVSNCDSDSFSVGLPEGILEEGQIKIHRIGPFFLQAYGRQDTSCRSV